MSDSKVNLRKIIGLEEEINRLAKQANMPRINGGKGIAWMDGYGENGKEPSQEEKEAAAEKDKGNTGSKNLDQKKDASDPLQIGDDAGDMGNMKICGTDTCVNVRLHGNARPPDGWNSVCDPPKDNTFIQDKYVHGAMIKRIFKDDTGIDYTEEKLIQDYRTSKEVAAAAKSFFRMDVTEPGSLGLVMPPIINKLEAGGQNVYLAQFVHFPEGKFKNSAQYILSASYMHCGSNPICNQPPPTDKWPKDQCSEIVAGSGGFKGACPAHDHNLPSQFGSAQNEITLCDKDGNEVKFTKTDEGYEVYQAKYRRTAVVDPNTYKVVKFK